MKPGTSAVGNRDQRESIVFRDACLLGQVISTRFPLLPLRTTRRKPITGSAADD
jgi:hypothetical protein